VQVPFFLARQLHKHVIGLVINEESRRYIKSDIDLWLPDVVHKAPAHAKQGASDEEHTEYVWGEYSSESNLPLRDGVDRPASQVLQIVSEQSVQAYYDLIDAGVAPEEARIVLPLNAMTTWIWSGSLLAFNRIYQLRKDGHAQNAAQEFANKLGKILYEHFPESMKALNYGEDI
jgi:thymidylate synthase (FAD)